MCVAYVHIFVCMYGYVWMGLCVWYCVCNRYEMCVYICMCCGHVCVVCAHMRVNVTVCLCFLGG